MRLLDGAAPSGERETDTLPATPRAAAVRKARLDEGGGHAHVADFAHEAASGAKFEPRSAGDVGSVRPPPPA